MSPQTPRRAILGLLALSLVACGPKTITTGTPPAPDPPQVRVLRIDRTLTDATNVAANLTASLYNAGKVDLGATQEIKRYLTALAKASDSIATECQSTDPWPTARLKIANTLTTMSLSVAPLDPDLRKQLTAVQGLVMQILGVQ